MTLVVVPECVQTEKGLAAGGTHQPHSHLAHMHTDGGTCGWWTLFTAFNLAPIHLLDATQLNAKGLHVGRDHLLWSLKDSWRGRLHCLVLWAPGGVDGRWWWMGYGKLSCGEMRLEIQRGVTLPPQKPIKTFHHWACHCCFHFPQPLSLQVLSLSFQPVGLFPQGTSPFQQVQPLKNKRKEEYRGRNIKGNRKPYGQQAGKKGREPTSSNSPCASSSGWAGRPPLVSICGTFQSLPPPLLEAWKVLHQQIHLPRKKTRLRWVMICWKNVHI